MSANIHRLDIAVVGGGPAGAAAALGLLRLGYRVGLIAEPRPFAAMEGISRRVIEGLRGAGLSGPLAELPAASPRQVRWNGQSSAANQETLVDRRCFDRAIMADLRQAGVALFECRAGRIGTTGQGWRIELSGPLSGQAVVAGFLVEARGRSAPAAGIERRHGPDTLSLLHYWLGPPGRARSAVESFAEGWAWMAAGTDGRRYLQLTLDSGSTRLPSKADLPRFCEARLRRLASITPFIEGARPTAQVHARTSGSVLHQQVIGDRWIRIGDAAMAVDPLSGNGIFQALSSALIAPAVINTLLHYPQATAVAKRFYQQRISELFYRFSRIGRDFYRMETQWPEQPFWHRRCGWPDLLPAHPPAGQGGCAVERRPVVDGDHIREAEVVVTPDQPLGIWHLQGIELAPLVRLLSRHGSATPGDRLRLLENHPGVNPQQARVIRHWFDSQALI